MSKDREYELHKERYSKAIHEAMTKGPDIFQGWFNTSKSVYQSAVAGHWDFAFHILKPRVLEFLENPEEKVALEIGYGGGRLINAACSYFKEVIGIDIHGEQREVEDFLHSQNKRNFHLITASGREVPVDSESVDFIFSFIVFQHLPTFENFVEYLRESFRCLKNEGVAQLYFGRYSRLNPLRQAVNFFRGYEEIRTAQVNWTSLVIRKSRVKALAKSLGFKVLETGPSYKGVPTGYPCLRGGQNYITLLKS